MDYGVIRDKVTPSWAFTGMLTGGKRIPSTSVAASGISHMTKTHLSTKKHWETNPITQTPLPLGLDVLDDIKIYRLRDNFQGYSWVPDPKSKRDVFQHRQNEGRLVHTMLTKPNSYDFVAK